jgi:hypothetical protein
MKSEKRRMTDLQQLERDTQNVNGLNEHGSYCDCIWCLEGNAKPAEVADLAKRELEQEMATMLMEDLPLTVAITRQDDLSSDEYTWRCLGTTGKASSFVEATREALDTLIGDFIVTRYS